MFLKLLALAIVGLSLAVDPLYETSGFHCKTKLSMRLDRRLHGEPRDAPPPFDVQVLDEEGHKTEYYEPGKIYTIRLIGYQYYRGLLLQPRLCDEHGFVIGSLRGGRFLETPDWIQYGIRLQECDMKYPLEDSVTHADDSRKFVTQIQWTTERDIGNVQFMFTIVSENDVYWERWRPQSAFLKPIYNKEFPSEVLRQVFYNEKYALKFLAGKFTSSQESKLPSSQEVMPKLEEILVATEKPEMPMEAKKVLEKMEMPEFWSHHDGEVKINNKDAEKTDTLEAKEKKEGESEFISDNKNSGEAKVNEEMIEEITESDEERVEEKPFIGDGLMSENETTTIPDHESITHLPDKESSVTSETKASLDSGEATVKPSEPETIKDEKPLKTAFEEAFNHDDIEIKEIEATIAPQEVTTELTTEATETTPIAEITANLVEDATTKTPTTIVTDEAEITTTISEESVKTTDPSSVTETSEAQTEESSTEPTMTQSEEAQPEKTEEETTPSLDETVMDKTTTDASDTNADDTSTALTEENSTEETIKDVEETTETSLDSETTPAENNEETEATTETNLDAEETTQEPTASTETPTAEEGMKGIENDLSHVTEASETMSESDMAETAATQPVEAESSNDLENEATTQGSMNDDMENSEATTEEPTTTESETQENVETTMNDDEVTREAEETTEMPIEETTELSMNEETTESSDTTAEAMGEQETTESPKMETDAEAKEEETTEAAIAETTENLNADEVSTAAVEENESTAKAEEDTTPSENVETTIVDESSTHEAEATTISAVEEATTEEVVTSTSGQETSTPVNDVTGTTPTFDELITTLPSLEKTASNITDVEPTTEALTHPKDISRRRR